MSTLVLLPLIIAAGSLATVLLRLRVRSGPSGAFQTAETVVSAIILVVLLNELVVDAQRLS